MDCGLGIKHRLGSLEHEQALPDWAEIISSLLD